MADWSELPRDVLAELLKRLHVVSHRLRCRAVCTSWQWVEHESQRFLPAPLQAHGLLVSGPNSETRKFYSLSEKKIYQSISLPVPYRLICFGITSNPGWLLSVDVVKKETTLFNPFSSRRIHLPPADKMVNIRGEPHEITAFENKVRKAASSGPINPVDDDDDDRTKLVVMIYHFGAGKLAFARPGDESWTLILKRIGRGEEHKLEAPIVDVIFFKEHFYALDTLGRVYRCDNIITTRSISEGTTSSSDIIDPKYTVVASFPQRDRKDLPWENSYLVESSGDLFVVVRIVANAEKWIRKLNEVIERQQAKYPRMKAHEWIKSDFECCSCEQGDETEKGINGDWDIDDGVLQKEEEEEEEVKYYSNYLILDEDAAALPYKTMYFKVYKMDMNGRKWVRVKNLDDRAFVLGLNASFSVSAPVLYGYRPNCIYFSDDNSNAEAVGRQAGHDNGVFCLEDRSIEYINPHGAKSPKIMMTSQWLTLIPS